MQHMFISDFAYCPLTRFLQNTIIISIPFSCMVHRTPTPSPFTADDLDSRNGFLTTVWGPSLWMTLHTISMNYPSKPTPTQKAQYKTFFDSLRHVLPCGKCRDNLVANFITTGYTDAVFESRDTLSKWVYELHACVNTMLGKSTPLSYTEMRHTFENFRARCGLDVSHHSTSNRCRYRRKRGGGGGKLHPNNTTTHRIEDGCTVPVTGIKSRCVLRIVPECTRTKTLKVDKRCLCRRIIPRSSHSRKK